MAAMVDEDVQHWTLSAPVVPASLILRLGKYRDLSAVPQAIRDAAGLVAAEATALASPEAMVWRGSVSVEDDVAVLGRSSRFHSRALARLLAGSTEAYVVVLTVGAQMEDRAREMFEAQQFLESFLMDTAAWGAIELCVRDVRRRLIAAERTAGRSVTHRLGPGHVDWPLTDQATLLGVFADAPLPVRLNDAQCMLPQKSISGVFGVISRRAIGDAPR